MDRNINAAVQQGLFDLAGEQALAADVFQRLVLNLITGDLDHHDLKRSLWQIMCRHQPRPRLMGLRQGKQRSAGADLEGLGGAGQDIHHSQGLSATVAPFKSPRLDFGR